MKRERKITLRVAAVLSACILFAAGFSGCDGCNGCSKADKDSKSGNVSVDTRSGSGSLNVTVYAYCPCSICNTPKWKGMVSSGEKIDRLLAEGKNICAADPNVIPMGSVVTYDGKDYVVADRGRKIKGNTINILLKSHRDVYAFGVKKDQTITYKK